MNGKIIYLMIACLFLSCHLGAENSSQFFPGLADPIKPHIPKNFVAIHGESGIRDWVYWGPQEVISNYLNDPTSLQTPIIRIRIDPENYQTWLNNTIDDDKFPEAIIINLEDYLGLALELQDGERKKFVGFLGLNNKDDEILTFELLYPLQHSEPDEETLTLWYDFIFSSTVPKKTLTVANGIQKERPSLSYKLMNFYTEEPSMIIDLIPNGFPKNVSLTLTTTKLNGACTTCYLLIDNNNELRFKDGKKFASVIKDAARGEIFTYTLATIDRRKKASIDVSFFPYKIKDGNGHFLSLTMVSPKGDIFIFKALGFKPEEVVTFYSKSEEEEMSHQVTANPDGSFTGMLNPAVIGKTNGHAMIEIRGKTTKNLKLDYTWGMQAFEIYKSAEKKEYLKGVSLNI